MSAQVELVQSSNLWPDLKFPPLNLWSMPKHDVLVYAHGSMVGREFNHVKWNDDENSI